MFNTNPKTTRTHNFCARFVDAVTVRPFLDDLHRMATVRKATADLIEFRRNGELFADEPRRAA